MAVKGKPVAFIYVNGDLWTGEAHWRIIEKIFMGDIAEFLYASQEVESTWGWIWFTGKKLADKEEAILELYTEIGPHISTIGNLEPVVDAVQKQMGVYVIDIETPDPPARPVLERYTPEGIETTNPGPKEYPPWGGSDKKPAAPKATGEPPVGTGTRFLKREIVRNTSEGDITVTTLDLRSYGADYETIINRAVMTQNAKQYGSYISQTSDLALHTHDWAVQNIEKIIENRNQGTIYPPPPGVEAGWGGVDDPGSIVSQTEQEKEDRLWEKVRQDFAEDSDTHMQELSDQIDNGNVDWPSKYMKVAGSGPWEGGDYSDNELMMADAPGFSVSRLDPPDGAEHESGERPFIYYAPTQTLFETNRDCHHEHVLHKIYNIIQAMTGEAPDMFSPEAWTWGDITSPEHTDRNWIKFISGPVAQPVVNYFLDKYPDRELMYSNGQPIPPNHVKAKLAFQSDPNYWRENNLPMNGAFGYINGQLVRAMSHHQLIMGALINNGWTWEQLMMAPQAWGWFFVDPQYYEKEESPSINLKFTSDAGFQTVEDSEVLGEFARLYKLPANNTLSESLGQGFQRGVDKEQYGTGLSGRGTMEMYINPEDEDYVGTEDALYDPVPPPPTEEELAQFAQTDG